MSPKVHVPCGIVSGSIAFLITKSFICAVACCFANFIFDFDHVLEYGLYCVKFKKKPSLKMFFSGKYFDEKGIIAVIFHGYEYVLLWLSLAVVFYFQDGWNYLLLIGILIGYSEHLILDLIGNDCTFKGYSLLYRMFVRFKLDLICDKKKIKKMNRTLLNSHTNL